MAEPDRVLRYAFGPVVVSTDEAIPELRSKNENAGVSIGIRRVSALAPGDGAVLLASDDDVDGLRIERCETGYRLAFPRFATFSYDPDDASITYCVVPGTPEATVRHLLLDQVLPRALTLLGYPTLHASAVAIDGRAAVFAGPSGIGKSTLAVRLALRGHDHLADDAVHVHMNADRPFAEGLCSGARLWPKDADTLVTDSPYTEVPSYGIKWRIPSVGSERPGSAHEVSRVFLVDRNDVPAPIVHTLSSLDALMGLVAVVFRLGLDHRAALTSEIGQLAHPAMLGRVRRLVVPLDSALDDRVLDLVEEETRAS